jgi:hypothetical protein
MIIYFEMLQNYYYYYYWNYLDLLLLLMKIFIIIIYYFIFFKAFLKRNDFNEFTFMILKNGLFLFITFISLIIFKLNFFYFFV